MGPGPPRPFLVGDDFFLESCIGLGDDGADVRDECASDVS